MAGEGPLPLAGVAFRLARGTTTGGPDPRGLVPTCTNRLHALSSPPFSHARPALHRRGDGGRPHRSGCGAVRRAAPPERRPCPHRPGARRAVLPAQPSRPAGRGPRRGRTPADHRHGRAGRRRGGGRAPAPGRGGCAREAGPARGRAGPPAGHHGRPCRGAVQARHRRAAGVAAGVRLAGRRARPRRLRRRGDPRRPPRHRDGHELADRHRRPARSPRGGGARAGGGRRGEARDRRRRGGAARRPAPGAGRDLRAHPGPQGRGGAPRRGERAAGGRDPPSRAPGAAGCEP